MGDGNRELPENRHPAAQVFWPINQLQETDQPPTVQMNSPSHPTLGTEGQVGSIVISQQDQKQPTLAPNIQWQYYPTTPPPALSVPTTTVPQMSSIQTSSSSATTVAAGPSGAYSPITTVPFYMTDGSCRGVEAAFSNRNVLVTQVLEDKDTATEGSSGQAAAAMENKRILEMVVEQLKAVGAALTDKAKKRRQLTPEEEQVQSDQLGWLLQSPIPNSSDFCRIVVDNLDTDPNVLARAFYDYHQKRKEIVPEANIEKVDKSTSTWNDPPDRESTSVSLKRSLVSQRSEQLIKKTKTGGPETFTAVLTQGVLKNHFDNVAITISSWFQSIGVLLLGAVPPTQDTLAKLLKVPVGTAVGSLNLAHHATQIMQDSNELISYGLKVLVKEEVKLSQSFEVLLASALNLTVETTDLYADAIESWSKALVGRHINFAITSKEEETKHILITCLSDMIFEWPLNLFEGVANTAFLLPDGASVNVPMLKSHLIYAKHLLTDKSEVLITELQNCLQVIFIKPRDPNGLNESAKTIAEDFSHVPIRKIRIFVPRIKIESTLWSGDISAGEKFLDQILCDNADYSKMGEMPKDVAVAIVANTHFELLDRYSEEGQARDPDEEEVVAEFRANRPFLFAVRTETGKTVLTGCFRSP